MAHPRHLIRHHPTIISKVYFHHLVNLYPVQDSPKRADRVHLPVPHGSSQSIQGRYTVYGPHCRVVIVLNPTGSKSEHPAIRAKWVRVYTLLPMDLLGYQLTDKLTYRISSRANLHKSDITSTIAKRIHSTDCNNNSRCCGSHIDEMRRYIAARRLLRIGLQVCCRRTPGFHFLSCSGMPGNTNTPSRLVL